MPKSPRSRKTSSTRATNGKNNGGVKGHGGETALIDSLVTALGGGENGGKKPHKGAASKNQNIIVLIQPRTREIVLYCPDKESACANLKELSTHGGQRIKVCEQMQEHLPQMILENSTTDPDKLKQMKRNMKATIKNLMGEDAGKSYKKKVRNGREYWYEVWWDPKEKKKKDKYIPKRLVPSFLLGGKIEAN
jgi:hypothetical protein